MPAINPDEVRFFSGQSHKQLAAGIARHLGVPLDSTNYFKFQNDTMYVQLGASVRGRSVFIIQSLTTPVSDHIFELFMMLDIARGAGAKEIHAIIPYYSYARSDKKDAPRISITARLLADLLQTAGASHIMTLTLHSPQVHGFFSVPTDPLTARPLFVKYLSDRRLDPAETIVVAPDIGRAKSAARFATRLGLHIATADKQRISDNHVIIGDGLARQVEGYRKALIYDDEIATGVSVITLGRLLVECGIQEIVAICTHGVFVGDAVQQLVAIPQVTEIITTDTVPIPHEKRVPQLTILSVAPIFAEAIAHNFNRRSIGDLFTYSED